MGTIKKLAGQTLTYGLSTIVGRFINFLLVPLYTAVYNPHDYGIVTDVYALVAFLNVVLVYGMETSFFNFARKDENSVGKTYATGFNNLIITTSIFLVLGSLFYKQIAIPLGYSDHPEYILWFVWILALDALSALPFALLRQLEKPIKFSILKLLWVGINVLLNLYFLLWAPHLAAKGISAPLFNPEIGLGYIFISNLVASLVVLILLLPECLKFGFKADPELRKAMLNYAWPLIFIGLAGIANEMFSRVILKYLAPGEDGLYELGVFGAFYKLSLIMTLFIQAFKFAAEPFFFSQHKNENAQVLYARIMDYFVMVCVFIFVVTMLFIDDLAALLIRNESYYEHPDGMKIVPILLMANLFLGIFYSISVWYRLTNNTKKGSKLSIAAAILTVVLNVLLIPKYGFLASAWATLIVYAFLAVANYIWGQKYYPVPYNLPKLGLLLGLALLIYGLAFYINPILNMSKWIVNPAWLLVFSGGLYLIEKQIPDVAFSNNKNHSTP
ncbi:MAG: lipopolysaccharide biosynthesis protein [Bacteroidia bacterium]